MKPAPAKAVVAALGAVLGVLMMLMKVVPLVPGHFSHYEWSALLAWCLVGIAMNWRARRAR